MPSSRLLGALAALACAGGMAVAAGPPAAASPASPASSVSLAAASGPAAAGARPARARTLPAHVFAPYYFGSARALAVTSRASGASYLALAFLQTARPGSCTVDWNGDPHMPVGKTYAAGIAVIQAAGGNVVPSFGGASADSEDEEIADSCHSVSAIAAQYEKVVTTYHVTRLDLDTEEDSLNNYAGIDRRNKAIALTERWARATRRTVQFVYTLPTNTTGLDQGGSYVLQDAAVNHARIAIVNAMTFDYYDNMPHEMADNTEGAAQQLYDRLHVLYPAKSARQLWGMIGITEDLGVDDYGPAETFTLADARTVERWAASRGLAELSFWNVQDDNSAGSQVHQSRYEFSHILEPFTSTRRIRTAARPAPPAPGAGPASSAGAAASTGPASSAGQTGPEVSADPQHGNFRSVSCPAASFCMAVDESGNNALAWNGRSWSAPVSIDPGGSRVELTDISCATSTFCAAVDTRGNALRWNGRSWSAPARIDPDGAGLTSVSCPSAAFCVTVDGDGNALSWDGTSWSRPARIDATGNGLQSVSCSSASFCAAGDWAGHALTWNGTAWSAPALVDPTTATAGGGLPSMSCPTRSFCVAADWEGGEVTWNGRSWSKPATFDSDGAGGLMSVTCRAASFCVAVDGSGDYLTWNGRSWSAPVQIDLTGDGFESVSCGSRSSCVAVDWDGNALRWNGTSWTTPALSCPHDTTSSAGQCKMAGSYADPRAGILTSVSCPDRSFCAAVDGNGEALTSGGRQPDGLQPFWSPPATIDPIAGVLTAVSCSSSSFCAAVDGSGHALTWNGVSWSRPVWSVSTPVDRGGGALSSVSCPASPAGSAGSFCVAVDGNGRALAWNGGSWSAPRLVDPRGGLTSVSCAARGFCLAVDGGGRALAWNGSAWSAPRLVDPRGGLTSVSCAARGFCVAVDGGGRALAWDGRSWSAPRLVDPRGGGLTAVSCPVRGYCIAADFDGQTVALHPDQPGHHGH